MSSYAEKRKAFYSQIPSFWSNIYGSEYSLYHVLPISEQTVCRLKEATERMGAVFFKTARLLRSLSDEQLLQLGYPRSSLPFLRLKSLFPESVISRFDFAVTDHELKLLEFNSDTPTFIVECFHVNGKACSEFGMINPNEKEERLLSSGITKAVIEASQGKSSPNIVFTAHVDHIEDWQTTSYLSALCQVENKMVPLSALQITDDALLDPDGMPIDVLYRQTYPLEHLVEDRDPETGDLIGIELLQLVKAGKLSILNPVSSFLLQPKSIQSLIWGLAENGAFYTDDEQKWIKDYMLPTYLEADFFEGRSSFVKKPSLGREGDTVTIWDQQSQLTIQNDYQTYKEELPVYQAYVPLPTVSLETEKGVEELSYVFGAFLIAGKASSIGVRAGGKITGNESYFLPVGIRKAQAP
ncbi:glutathionylspermidine synthase family protein [Neobacillus sp. PS2-9]|uniref:glutathionylspermidine synthase family protein n=1 Tax=Neobacillus sp. PS2-9 TaxID=3070676 RepID=UPI0027DFAEA0|nr:glutathionylspermidine synthase family protein [Neobacillus sp. PS2-9]WML57544.1 glutathionylspermidine synthase family protein [Neobacillus sp. PS2-9]